MPLATHEDVLQYGTGPIGFGAAALGALVADGVGAVKGAATPYARPPFRSITITGQRAAQAAHRTFLAAPAQLLVMAALAPWPTGGLGAATLPMLQVRGTGRVLVAGTGAITLPALTVAGTGLGPSTAGGTGAITLGAVTVSGAGTVADAAATASGRLTRTLRPSGLL